MYQNQYQYLDIELNPNKIFSSTQDQIWSATRNVSERSNLVPGPAYVKGDRIQAICKDIEGEGNGNTCAAIVLEHPCAPKRLTSEDGVTYNFIRVKWVDKKKPWPYDSTCFI